MLPVVNGDYNREKRAIPFQIGVQREIKKNGGVLPP
jgi:hypothetical protein